ncbi:MAG: FecR domain-containing protein, partial [Porphyrobacter sp.]|nr:FecR domain-containing protein [Porphyrobacter sp.]
MSRLVLAVLLTLVGTAPAYAQTGPWTISEAKGGVVVIDASGERAAKVGQAIAPGATVRTRAKATAVLVRGSEFVTLRQNAQIRIPEAARSRSITKIIQDYGSALFNIGKKADPHFGVETPYLAAVVKGTTFVITVGNQQAVLQVTEGAVEASTRDGGARELVRPGTVAMVAAADSLRLVIEGDGRRVIDSPARGAGGTAAPVATPAPALADGDVQAPAPASPSAEVAEAPSPMAAPDPIPVAADERGARRISAVIASSAGDVRAYSGGFASGEVAVVAAAIAADNTARAGEAPFSLAAAGHDDSAVCYRGLCGGPAPVDIPAEAPAEVSQAETDRGPEAPGNSENAPGRSGDAPADGPGNSENAPGQSDNAPADGPGNSENAPGQSDNAPADGPGNSENAPGRSGDAPADSQGNSENAPGRSGDAPADGPGNGENAPGRRGDTPADGPGNSENAPGRSDDAPADGPGNGENAPGRRGDTPADGPGNSEN